MKKKMDPDWEADKARYPERAWIREQSYWAIALYRFGRRVDNRKGIGRKMGFIVYQVLYKIMETFTGITLYKTVEVGPGLRIHHFGNIVIHSNTVIGSNCTLRHGVTIGNRHVYSEAPVIGDNVDIGCYAQILGPIQIGDGAKIGAMSLVLQSVPAGETAVGVPARIIKKSKKL